MMDDDSSSSDTSVGTKRRIELVSDDESEKQPLQESKSPRIESYTVAEEDAPKPRAVVGSSSVSDNRSGSNLASDSVSFGSSPAKIESSEGLKGVGDLEAILVISEVQGKQERSLLVLGGEEKVDGVQECEGLRSSSGLAQAIAAADEGNDRAVIQGLLKDETINAGAFTAHPGGEAVCVSKVGDSKIDEKVEIVVAGGQTVGTDGYGSGHEEIPEASNLRCSLNVKVIDETALIQSPSVSNTKNGNGKEKGLVDCAQSFERSGKKSVNQEMAGKKENKKNKKRGKRAKKGLESNGKEHLVNPCEPCVLFPKDEGEPRRVYLTKQLEALRFVDVVGQRKLWNEMYKALGSVVAKEYEGLAISNQQKRTHFNVDPRQRFGQNQQAPAILGEVCSHFLVNEVESTKDNGVEILNSSEAYGHDITGEDGNKDPQEAYIEDCDSDEEYCGILRPAFMVDGEPDFDSGPPTDGLEYLRRVRWEAAQIPKVKVAKVNRSKFNKDQTAYMLPIPDITKCPDHLLPSKEWEDAFLADFSKLRLALSSFEGSISEDSNQPCPDFTFHEFRPLPDNTTIENADDPATEEVLSYEPLDCSLLGNLSSTPHSPGDPADHSNLKPEQVIRKSSTDEISIDNPTVSAVLGMDSVTRISILRRYISSVDPMGALSRNHGLWLFALCAAIDTPLDADTCAAVRSLLRTCASLRAARSELDDEVVMLNILATISGRYFGQMDN